MDIGSDVGLVPTLKLKQVIFYLYSSGPSDDLISCGSGHETAAVLLPGFAIKLIAKPGNKTAAVSWPDPYCTGVFQDDIVLIMAVQIWVNIGSGNASYLREPSHYLNQCWLLTSEILWHSSVAAI